MDFFQKKKATINLNDKEKLELYSDLLRMVANKIDLAKTFELLLLEKKETKKVLFIKKAFSQIKKGNSLSNAFNKSGNLSEYEIQTIQIGEETGQLHVVLDQLIHYYKNKIKLRNQILSLATYPIFIFSLTIGVLYFMLTSVVPMFKDVFKQFNQELPYMTKLILSLSDNIKVIFGFLIVITTLTFLIHVRLKQKKKYRKWTSDKLTRIPIIGSLIVEIHLARLFQSLSVLLASRVTLIRSLELASKVATFYPIQEQITFTQVKLKKGSSLYASIYKSKLINQRMVAMIKLAEEVNELDIVFNDLANDLQNQIDHKTERISKIIEPLVICIVGGIVGFIMVSLYLPMFNLSNVVQ